MDAPERVPSACERAGLAIHDAACRDIGDAGLPLLALDIVRRARELGADDRALAVVAKLALVAAARLAMARAATRELGA